MAPVPNRSTYGGVFQARTSRGLDEDVVRIQELGFVVLATERQAGQTKVIVHGPSTAVDKHINDFELKKTLPGKFILLPKGEELDASLVRRWTDSDRVIF